jgi:putative transposase
MSNDSTARERFLAIKPVLDRSITAIAAAERVGVSRQTIQEWMRRHREEGMAGLESRPPIAHSRPHALSAELVELIVGLRLTHSTWGPKKLQEMVARQFPRRRPPAMSTIGDLLHRHNLIVKRRRRPAASARVPRDFQPITGPNDTWSIDFKGHWALRDGLRCHPLTIEDSYSRFLLGCQAFHHEKFESVWPVFESVFRKYGLPGAMRFDSGAPFSSPAAGGLSRLSARFVRLGIRLERTDPGSPAQNGRLERLHRTLKAEVERKPDLASQQPELDRWRRHYNEERPHEALGQKMPVERYKPSPRRFPRTSWPEIEYCDEFQRHLVSTNGCIQWQGTQAYVSHILAGDYVGLRHVTEQHFEVRYGEVLLGTLDNSEPKRALRRYG